MTYYIIIVYTCSIPFYNRIYHAVKVKLSLCLISYGIKHYMKTYWGVEV
jgi:hypothetical protein